MSEQNHSIPERNLLAAIVRRALYDFLSGSSIERMAAKEWLLEEEPLMPFSFLWVCEHLNLEPAVVVGRLSKLKRSLSPALQELRN